jgi:hypothetical protein
MHLIVKYIIKHIQNTYRNFLHQNQKTQLYNLYSVNTIS